MVPGQVGPYQSCEHVEVGGVVGVHIKMYHVSALATAVKMDVVAPAPINLDL